MTGNDYLKLLIGDLAFQLASAKSRIDELESPVPLKEAVSPTGETPEIVKDVAGEPAP